jgi:uncharacterized protein YggT (Ycf19 family)
MDPQQHWPDPPPPLMAGDEIHTVEERYVAREVDPRYPPREIPERYVPEPVASDEAERARRVYAVARTSQIIYLALGALETLLILRFVLKLLAANPQAAFSSFIYALTEAFVAPFEGVFQTPETQGSILDLAAVLAMIIYALIVWGIVSLLYTLGNRRPA